MKLSISLEEQDLVTLKEFLAAQPVVQSSTILARVASAIADVLETDTLIDAKVTALLSRLTSIPADIIKNEHSLQFHLGMGPKRINALAGPLTLIAQSIKPNADTISISEAAQLTTVQSCIDLIKTKLL